MKHEVYSCLKMLETLRDRIVSAHNIGRAETCKGFRYEYERIYHLLEKHLDDRQMEFVPPYPDDVGNRTHDGYLGFLLNLLGTCDVCISYLKSLDMDLSTELAARKEELDKKEREIQVQAEENEFTRDLLKKSLDAISKFPELQRSKIVEDIKKTHRGIEEHSRPPKDKPE